MLIQVDSRETELFNLMNSFIALDSKLNNIELETTQLEVGDICIRLCRESTETIIIERKSIKDLASSIIDGRYKEQSYRLFHTNIPKHNIIYLIEGKISDLNQRFTRIKPNALYSAMIVLQYFKGFSVFRTMSIKESAEYIIRITDKINRESTKGYYDGYVNPYEGVEYQHIVSKNKKTNITPENIGELMLCQIPSVSSNIAKEVMKRFKTIAYLIESIKESGIQCFDSLFTTNSKGQQRNISSTAKVNMVHYLVPNTIENEQH